MDKKKIVVFTGAGISADSGVATFRDSDGLWANHRIEDVCTPEALACNRAGVIDFYNQRRRDLLTREPNAAHHAVVELARCGLFDVSVITQNIDDLHERADRDGDAGASLSLPVLHLHGELRKLRSSVDEQATVPIVGWEQGLADRHADGSLLRPFVVFFGESVPRFEDAVEIVEQADILIVVGTSLAVYPAASLVNYLPAGGEVWVVDPAASTLASGSGSGLRGRYAVNYIAQTAALGLPPLVKQLMEKYR